MMDAEKKRETKETEVKKKQTKKPYALERVFHEFPPVYDENSRVLILGSIPSPKSREQQFYYGHPRNRFWKILSSVLSEPLPESIEEKKAMLLRHHIALWDVLAECSIHGADDGSISDPVPNDIGRILRESKVKTIFTTGTKAQTLYMKHCYPDIGVASIRLPSTSPANCGMKDEALLEAYRKITECLSKDKGAACKA